VTAESLLIETRFGAFAARDRDIVTLANGLPGFERCRRYVLVAAQSLEPFACLQGLDEPRPSFLAIDPRIVLPGYETTLDDADARRLELSAGDTPLWLAIVRLEADAATVNLRAPIVVNPRRMIGLQLLPAQSPHSCEHRLPLD
jgi:flagellar assembly factor FliW